jgi:hypothetical protein
VRPVPRYFFHVIDGKDIPDNDGTELADSEEARSEAVVLSGELLRDLGSQFWNSSEWQIHVEDEAGDKVCALKFSADRS